MDANTIKLILPWIFKLSAILGVLYVVNIPISQWIDTMYYGSPEAAERARRENAMNTAQVRQVEESNVLRQVESLASGDGLYRSQHQGQTMPGEIIKGVVFLLQFLAVMWLYFKIFH